MATYVVGDIQGCNGTLGRLLDRVDFGPGDRLWCVGDLVNRGPDNVGVLRRLMGLGRRAVCVLGNHDLHLLGCAAGLRSPKKRDTIADVLEAPDRDALVGWLRERPLLHRDEGVVMVHAGLLPSWSSDEAEGHARRMEVALRGGRWPDEALLGVLTRIRFVDARGRPDYGPKVGPEDAPPELRPWFEARPATPGETVVFGHWAALGLYLAPGYVGLDTGCVWGQRLTAWRLEDGAVCSEPRNLAVDPGER